jgi:hypothetical protein
MEFFFAGLALVFITLNLIKKINWSWGLVLLPIWAPVAVAFFGGFLVGLAGV